MADALNSAPVLVVDDDPDLRDVVALALGLEGYFVLTATNGREALAHITTRPPSVVLLDLQMPVMSGWELVARLRDIPVAVPVVFMTAGHRAEQEAERHQVAGYLAKPFDLDTLYDVVERFTLSPRA
jgi:CheY-like chemotaxis protein